MSDSLIQHDGQESPKSGTGIHGQVDGGATQYQVQEEIGRGGMGAILRAEDPDLRRDVAMKVLLENERGQLERFLEEAQITGQLEHPNIVPVHQLGIREDGQPFFTMKLVKGKSLDDILTEMRRSPRNRSRVYSLGRLLRIFLRICDAMAFAHARGVIHRDLKPRNIMIGDFGEVLVMDWGLAKVVENRARGAHAAMIGKRSTTGRYRAVKSMRSDTRISLTMKGHVCGTPTHMSPEQALGQVLDTRSDIYSLGVILYEILTLCLPVRGKDIEETMQLAVDGRIIPPSTRAPKRNISADLSAIAMKALSKRAEDRYPSPEDMREDIELYLDGRSVSAREDSLLEILAKALRRNRGAGIAGALGLLAFMTLAGASYWTNLQERSRAEQALNDLHAAEAKRREQQRASAPAYLQRAEHSLRNGDVDSAILDLGQAIDFDDQLEEARFLRAAVLLRQGKVAESAEDLEDGLALSPDSERLAEFAALLKRYRSSREDYALLMANQFYEKHELFFLIDTSAYGSREQLLVYRKQLKDLPDVAARLVYGQQEELSLSLRGKATLKDLEPLRGIPLIHLTVNHMKAGDLTPLKGMPLKTLSIRGSLVRDLTPLRGMQLERLDIRGTQVEDLTPLAGMPLRVIALARLNVTLTPLANMKLESFTAHQCRLERMDVLLGQPIETLEMSGNSLSDASLILRFPLKRLDLAGSRNMADWSWLRNLKGVEDLDLGSNKIDDLSLLRHLPLKRLSLADCPNVKDLSALKGMPLDVLDLRGCHLPDVRSLMEVRVKVLCLTPERIGKNLQLLKAHPTLTGLSDTSYRGKSKPVAVFLKEWYAKNPPGRPGEKQ